MRKYPPVDGFKNLTDFPGPLQWPLIWLFCATERSKTVPISKKSGGKKSCCKHASILKNEKIYGTVER